MGVQELWALTALGDLELGLGRPDAALAHYSECEELRTARGIEDADLSQVPELTETLLRLGRADDAAVAAVGHDGHAQAKGQPWALARAARVRALLAPDDELERHFDEALGLHAQTPDVFESARTRLAYGARLRRSGSRVRAREQLREAIELFDDLGAEPWSSLARVELEATGETARKRDPSTLDQLTPQEVQIALLLAGGSTTREAAAAMFLSPKTIEYHLRNIYRKLGIHSRPELVGGDGAQALRAQRGGCAACQCRAISARAVTHTSGFCFTCAQETVERRRAAGLADDPAVQADVHHRATAVLNGRSPGNRRNSSPSTCASKSASPTTAIMRPHSHASCPNFRGRIVKAAAQAGDDLVHPGASRFPRLPQHARSVRVAGEAMKGRRDACRLESLCVRLGAVAEDVVLCDENVRRRDPRQIARDQRRRVRLRPVRRGD